MAPMMLTFDVYEDDYVEFIKRIRDVLAHSTSHGIPVLRPQEVETVGDERWLDVELTAGESRITLRVDRRNLYVRGYRSGEQHFWEFRESQMIDGGQPLGFESGYVGSGSMGGRAGFGDRGLEALPLGRSQLENAIHNLANHRDVPRSLLVTVQMISEPVRFVPIGELIGGSWDTHQTVRLTPEMVAMERGWANLSTAVLRTQPESPGETPLPGVSPDNPTHVTTLRQALATLGILLIEAYTRGGASCSRHKRISVDDYGRCLMNLEYVCVNNIDGENPGNLYGTVMVSDGWFTYTFYDRTSDNCQYVGPGSLATLTDPSRPHAVSGADSFVISLDLFDHDPTSFDDKIAQGEIFWDLCVECVTFANYDKHLQHTVKGDYGDVTVGYSVLSNARSVTIQVLLINGDGEDPADVYGMVGAFQNLGGTVGPAPITLFRKSIEDYVKVRPGKPIPLTRKVMAASTATNLTIEADLWDHDTLISPDDAIAQGRVTFTVQPGTQKQFINGQHGQVQVIITCE